MTEPNYSPHQIQSGSAVPGQMPEVMQIPTHTQENTPTPAPDCAAAVADATGRKDAQAAQLYLS